MNSEETKRDEAGIPNWETVLAASLKNTSVSSPAFLAGLAFLSADSNSDIQSIIDFINQKCKLNITISGNPTNSASVTVVKDPLSITFNQPATDIVSVPSTPATDVGVISTQASSSPPSVPTSTNSSVASAPEAPTSTTTSVFQGNDAAAGQIPLPQQWVCSLANISLVSPRLKADFYLCADRIALAAKDKCYHIPFSSLQRVFLLPDPNGEELTLTLILRSEAPLLIGKAKHTMVLLRMDKLSPITIAWNNAITHPFILSARTALDAALGPFLDQELSVNTGAPVPSSSARVADAVEPVLTSLFAHAATAEVSSFPDVDTAGVCSAVVKKPSLSVFRSNTGNAHVHCYYKASDGPLFPLKDGILFLGKPLLWIPAKDVLSVNAESRGGRSFDLRIEVENPNGKKPITHEFGLIASEEQSSLTNYCTALASRRGDEEEPQRVVLPPPPVVAARAGARRSVREAVQKSSSGLLRMVDENDDGASESEEYMSEGTSESDEDEDEDEDVDVDVEEYDYEEKKKGNSTKNAKKTPKHADNSNKPVVNDDDDDVEVMYGSEDEEEEEDDDGYASDDGIEDLSEEEPVVKRRRTENTPSTTASTANTTSTANAAAAASAAASASVSMPPPAPVRRARPGSAL